MGVEKTLSLSVNEFDLNGDGLAGAHAAIVHEQVDVNQRFAVGTYPGVRVRPLKLRQQSGFDLLGDKCVAPLGAPQGNFRSLAKVLPILRLAEQAAKGRESLVRNVRRRLLP